MLAAGGGGAARAAGAFGGHPHPCGGVADNADPTSLAMVTLGSLSSQQQVSATLGYAGSYSVLNQATGVFTQLPPAGQVVRRRQLNANLVALGYATSALNGLFLALGAVALLVGGTGVANIMVISVLERRSEIGLRRALGATRGQIRAQFLLEAIPLALLGGAAGIAAGAAATAIYASAKHWAIVIPPLAWAGGVGAAIAIGVIAGVLRALRAARLPPTEALRTA